MCKSLIVKGLCFFFILFVSPYLAQDKDSLQDKESVVLGGEDSLKIFKPTIQDYRYRTEYQRYSVVDTTFHQSKIHTNIRYHKEDDFGYIPFFNLASGYQDLLFRISDREDFSLLPSVKNYFIQSIKKIRYYDVKTPTTIFFYNNGMNNGGTLRTTYTQNFGKNFNFSLEYMGLRSKGYYLNSLSASNHIILSANYKTKNEKYGFFVHYLHQNINNEENGGVKDLSVFLSGDERFNNRENIAVNLSNSDSRFGYRRYYFSQYFSPFSVESGFKISHQFYYQLNKYYFNIDSGDVTYFSDYNTAIMGNTKKNSENLSNAFHLIFDKNHFYLSGGIRHQNLIFSSSRFESSTEDRMRKSENRIGFLANLKMNFQDRVQLESDLEFSRGGYLGNFLKSETTAKLEPFEGYFLRGNLIFKSTAPQLNYLLNSSPVVRFHYDNHSFKNENILNLNTELGLKWWDTKLFLNYFRIQNFSYLDENVVFNQSSNSLNISQIGAETTLKYLKFNLNTRIFLQNQLSSSDLYPAPNLVARVDFYYKNSVFKKAADVLIGARAYYFSSFKSRIYAPILNEFILPTNQSYHIGGEPIFDFYIHMKVKRMQFYVEAQHLNTLWGQNKSYTAPHYPLYDFRFNLGLVWYLFN